MCVYGVGRVLWVIVETFAFNLSVIQTFGSFQAETCCIRLIFLKDPSECSVGVCYILVRMDAERETF